MSGRQKNDLTEKFRERMMLKYGVGIIKDERVENVGLCDVDIEDTYEWKRIISTPCPFDSY